MIKASDIQIKTGEVEGYGGPGYHWVLVHFENVQLEWSKHYSEREAGKAEALYEQRWKQHDWQDAEWANAIEGKPLASPPCSNCGQHTLEGTVSQWERIWCKRAPCQIAQKEWAALKKAEYDKSLQRQAADTEKWKQEWKDKAKEAQTGFHWRDGRFFKRMEGGSVRVSHVNGESLQSQYVIPAAEWASIVCSVSAEGETDGRWNAAQDFHGRSTSDAATEPK